MALEDLSRLLWKQLPYLVEPVDHRRLALLLSTVLVPAYIRTRLPTVEEVQGVIHPGQLPIGNGDSALRVLTQYQPPAVEGRAMGDHARSSPSSSRSGSHCSSCRAAHASMDSQQV